MEQQANIIKLPNVSASVPQLKVQTCTAAHAAVCILGTTVMCPKLLLLSGSHQGAAGSRLWHSRDLPETVYARSAQGYPFLMSPVAPGLS